MVGRIREVGGIIADEHVRQVQVHRQGVLQGMVDGAAEGHDGIFARGQREILPASGQLPDHCHDRREIREHGLPRHRVAFRPVIDGSAVVRRQGAETEAVQIRRLEVVVVDDEVLVALVSAFLRGLAATAAVDFLDDEPAGRRMRQAKAETLNEKMSFFTMSASKEKAVIEKEESQAEMTA